MTKILNQLNWELKDLNSERELKYGEYINNLLKN